MEETGILENPTFTRECYLSLNQVVNIESGRGGRHQCVGRFQNWRPTVGHVGGVGDPRRTRTRADYGGRSLAAGLLILGAGRLTRSIA
jgi:hypothetical protein